LLRGCRITQPAAFWRRRVIEEEQLDSSLAVGIDYEYWLRLGKIFHFVHVPRLWATDRNQPGRIILTRRDELNRQKWTIRRKYGQCNDAIYHLQHLLDKLVYGLPSRVKGLLALPGLYKATAEDFAIPIRLEPAMVTTWRQLWRKNRDLL
jgi:hypothetical protein